MSQSWLARLRTTAASLAVGVAAGTVVAVMMVAALYTLARFRVDAKLQPPATILILVATGMIVQVVSVRAAERRAPRVMTLLSLFCAWAGLAAGEAMTALHIDRELAVFAREDLVAIVGGAIGAAMGVWMGASLVGWRVRPAKAPSPAPAPVTAPRRGMVALVKAGPGAPKPFSGPTRTKVSLHAVEHVCPICADDGNPLRARGPNVWVCDRCGAWHHVDCWRQNGEACGVLGQH